MSSQVRPSFFCSRPNGSLTPLIALDDLPAGITVRGISRTLTPGETQGMISCGAIEPRSEPWALEGATQAGRGAIANDDDSAELQAVLLKIMADENTPTHMRMAINGILYRHLGASLPPVASLTEAATGRQSAAPFYSGSTRGNAGHKHGFNAKKEFCSYWIRHGECDYQQQGCLYKHEMPTDIVMLEKLGLRDIPRWYREKYNVPSLLQANYGNHHRGQHHPDAVDQPANKAIQHHSAANNESVVAGPSVPATGITNAANNASTAGPSGHAHPNANVAHKTGNNNAGHKASHKNNHGTCNQHGPANSRGCRFESLRGAGFGAGKGRGNPNWGKNSQHYDVAPPPASVGNETRGDYDNSGTASSNISSESGFRISPRTQMSLLASPLVDPMINLNLSGQPTHFLDKDGEARKLSLTARLRELTPPEDSFASPIPEQEEAEEILYRSKTRHVFNFGGDGDNKLAAAQAKGTPAFDPFARLAKDETAQKSTTTALVPMIRELVATSEPIDPKEPLINWGPIGEPVQRPAPTMNTTYAMALINGQAQTGINRQFAYPYMGQH